MGYTEFIPPEGRRGLDIIKRMGRSYGSPHRFYEDCGNDRDASLYDDIGGNVVLVECGEDGSERVTIFGGGIKDRRETRKLLEIELGMQLNEVPISSPVRQEPLLVTGGE